jgi:hypothetical protein
MSDHLGGGPVRRLAAGVRVLATEPLLHFALVGALLFAAHAWLNPDAGGPLPEQPTVRIGEGDVRWLTATWTRQWNREPTQEELRGLLTTLLEEQLLAREARELGLDENDTIVRRRLAQKVEFLVQDTARLSEPTDDELRRFYDAHRDRFQTAGRVSFAHVFFGGGGREDPAADARAALAELARPGVVSGRMGDRLSLDSEFRDADEQTVATLFGPAFAGAVMALQPGTWTGPLASGYGQHLVRVSHVVPPATRGFADARGEVLERWREAREREQRATFVAALMQKYVVTVDESVEPLIGPLAAAMRKGA